MNIHTFFSIGYTGMFCEEDVDECASGPCLNDGICDNHVNSYKCLCPIGFAGKKCEINEDDCSGRPCQNGAKCIDDVARHICLCPPGILFSIIFN